MYFGPTRSSCCGWRLCWRSEWCGLHGMVWRWRSLYAGPAAGPARVSLMRTLVVLAWSLVHAHTVPVTGCVCCFFVLACQAVHFYELTSHTLHAQSHRVKTQFARSTTWHRLLVWSAYTARALVALLEQVVQSHLKAWAGMTHPHGLCISCQGPAGCIAAHLVRSVRRDALRAVRAPSWPLVRTRAPVQALPVPRRQAASQWFVVQAVCCWQATLITTTCWQFLLPCQSAVLCLRLSLSILLRCWAAPSQVSRQVPLVS